MPKQKYQIHTPVLLNEVLQYLNPESGQSYLDVTAGYGGHAAAVLERTSNPSAAVLVDRDNEAIAALAEALDRTKTEIMHSDFLSASEALAEQGREFDMILADLGVSSLHLSKAERGFSLSNPGPLDMRMDSAQELNAERIVNTYSEEKLKRILEQYGEEPKAAQIASRIVQNRPIKTTDQLAQIVAKAWPGHSKIHPATRTFQALRIAVNSELDQLTSALPMWLKLLAPGGRLVVISFHSLEDRIVKQFIAEHSGNDYEAELTALTKKPVMATNDEIVSNPRARSAKLRVCRKK